ncbi:hypothetical protein HY768_07305 [candidate division TA06 bacterium]|uniref:Uncharacterized protein n=1 Tax=candidate division TA06 bacterium TaxID=2250710 RepID=A0A933I9E7_UNCT6|nr:hypothetical protein [candidate division TA06 bacterium]
MADAPATQKVSKTESGHARNSANFGLLITTVEGYGTKYNPTVPELAVAKLKTTRTGIDSSLLAVATADAPYKTTVNKRQEAFDGMSQLATRVSNALAVVASDRENKDAMTLVKKIRGGGKVKIEDPAQAAKGKSTSQMSYDNRVANFKALVALLGGIPTYKPNEADLKVAALNAYLDTLPGLGDAVNKAAVALAKARANRDNLLYAKGTGAVDLGLKAKKYVKSVFGSSSPEFKSISKIELKKV